MKYEKNQHKDKETVNSLDKIKTLNSIKVLNGVCLHVKQEFLNLAPKLPCKTTKVAVMESMGSRSQKLLKPQLNATHSVF